MVAWYSMGVNGSGAIGGSGAVVGVRSRRGSGAQLFAGVLAAAVQDVRLQQVEEAGSRVAVTSRGSGNTAPHWLNGRLLASPMLARSSRSVMVWNSNSALRGSIRA